MWRGGDLLGSDRLGRGGGGGGSGDAELLGGGDLDTGLLLGFQDGDNIGESVLGTLATSGVGVKHDLDLDAQDTLAEQDVADSGGDEVAGGLARVDHEAVAELHGLGTSSTELARDDNLATLGARLHDEADNTVARTANSKTVEELELDRLALSNGAQATVLDALGVQLNSVLGELETLLDQGRQLTDATALFAKNVLGVSGTDDDPMKNKRKRASMSLKLGCGHAGRGGKK